MAPSRKQLLLSLIWLAMLAASLILLALTTFWTPVSNDAGAYLTIADRILAGQIPFRDLFDHKGPGIYYLFAAVLAVSGRSLVAVQIVQLAGLAALAAVTGWLGRRLFGAVAGGLALLLALYGSAAYAGGHLTVEPWVALPTVVALGLLLRRRPDEQPTAWDWLVAGLLVGLSALFKQTGAATLVAFAAWASTLKPKANSQSRNWPEIFRRRWLPLLGGFLLPLGLVAATFAAQGALDDLWRDTVLANLLHYGPEAPHALLHGNLQNLRAFPLLWAALLPAVIWRPKAFQASAGIEPNADHWLLWLTLAASLAPLLHHSYGHYLLQALPAASLLGGAGLVAAGQRLAARPQAVRWIALVLVLALALVDLTRWPPYLRWTRTLALQQAEVGAFVEAATQPAEPILAITAAPQFYFLADRPPASRWLYLYPVNYSPQRGQELVALIERRAVATVIVDDRDPVPWHGELRAAVEAACRLQRSFGADLHVFRCAS